MVFKYLAVGLLLCHAHTGSAEEKPAYRLGYRTFYDGRIINGHDAEEGQFPHQILLFRSFLGYKELICGGSIINREWVLTAAHCVVNEYTPRGNYRVAAGKHVLNNIEESEQISKVTLALVHEDYLLTGPNDIALLKLETPLRLNERVVPVTLPKQDVIHNGTVTLSGWGSTGSNYPNVLQTIDIPLIQYDDCEANLNNLLGLSNPLQPSNVCTGPLGGNVAACFGDSGGPLVQYTEDNEVEQVGIVSWGIPPCGSKGTPTVYTRVSHFVDWIENTISNN